MSLVAAAGQIWRPSAHLSGVACCDASWLAFVVSCMVDRGAEARAGPPNQLSHRPRQHLLSRVRGLRRCGLHSLSHARLARCRRNEGCPGPAEAEAACDCGVADGLCSHEHAVLEGRATTPTETHYCWAELRAAAALQALRALRRP